MRQTTNYGLKMPEGSDTVNIDDLNYNTGIIDQKLKDVENKTSNIKVPVESVNGKTGKVELKAVDIKASDGITVESHLADTTKIIGNINDANLDASLKGKSLTEMAKVLFQNANSIKTKIADAIGSSSLKDNTGEEIANYIKEEKKRLCSFASSVLKISMSENDNFNEIIKIFLNGVNKKIEKDLTFFDESSHKNHIFRTEEYLYNFSHGCIEVYDINSKNIIKKMQLYCIGNYVGFDKIEPSNNKYCYSTSSIYKRKDSDDDRYYDFGIFCYYLNDNTISLVEETVNTRSLFPTIIANKEHLYVFGIDEATDRSIIKQYVGNSIISSVVIYEPYRSYACIQEHEIALNSKYICCYHDKSSNFYIYNKNLSLQKNLYTSGFRKCICNEKFLYIESTNSLTQYSFDNFEKIQEISMEILFKNTGVGSPDPKQCELLSVDEQNLYILYKTDIFKFDAEKLTFKYYSLFYYDKHRDIYKNKIHDVFV